MYAVPMALRLPHEAYFCPVCGAWAEEPYSGLSARYCPWCLRARQEVD
jgi:hypothetical protein